MKHTLKCTILTIGGKLRLEVRAVVDDRSFRDGTMSSDGTRYSNVSLMSSLQVSLVRPHLEGSERPPWNPNDSILLTKYYIPIFYRELSAIYDAMKIPNLYSYNGDKLEVDTSLAEANRRVFKANNVTMVELSPVVISQDGVEKPVEMEGIKLKINNEASTVLLTLNDVASLLWNIDHCNIDVIALSMFHYYVQTGERSTSTNSMSPSWIPEVDIKPLNKSE